MTYTNAEPIKGYCNSKQVMCEYANDLGYCKVTACVHSSNFPKTYTSNRMTRETAIALLNNLRAFAEDDDEPAIDMAIKSLQKDIERHEMVIRASERHLGIVRCKDCKWWVRDGNDSFGYAMFCDHDCSLGGQGIKKPTDFCSYGERREP